MDRYQKVQKPKPESPVNQNEIRITSQGLERRVREIVLKAMGQAISKTVAVAEIVKVAISGSDPYFYILPFLYNVKIYKCFPFKTEKGSSASSGHRYQFNTKLHQTQIKVDSSTIIHLNNASLLDKHMEVTTLIHMDGEEDVVEGGAEAGTEADILTTEKMVDIKVGIPVVMVDIRVATQVEMGVIVVATLVDILTGGEVAGVGVGAIEVMDMEGAEVAAAEALHEAVEGWEAVVGPGVAAIKHSRELVLCLLLGLILLALPFFQL
ncbi:alba DNA/RNA-binding protein [Striga asiatica]|uniref:Alba DNA/RNA-binding protein n=1 Tax=Striga asiatica TaxID=4170 RepID=A0A5A7Q842_STRAF|nr:alba DNA/RNA-binding protein [Striga asiatica]